MTDGRGGLQSEGRLTVESVQGVGVLAYSETGSFVNTAALDGQAITSSVTVVQLYDRAATSTAPTSAFACASSDASVVTVQASCSVTLTEQLVQGGAVFADVLGASGEVLARVPLAVWYPVSVSVSVEDSELGRVSAVGVSGSCESGAVRYQQTEATATATFGGVSPAVGQVDVSGLVAFSTDDVHVAVVSGRSVRGVGTGSSLVRAGVAAAALSSLPASLTVSANAVTVSGLRAAVLTSVTWTSITPSVVPWSPIANMTAAVQLVQAFSQEGDAGDLVAYALFSDGSELRLPASELLVSPSTSGVAASLATDTWGVSVQVGAVRECGDLLTVEWRVCNQSAAQGAASLNLKLPSVTAIHATVLASRLAAPGDSASVAPISLPSSATVRVLVDFSDSTQRDFSADSRTVVEIDPADASCARVDGINTLVVLPSAACERVTVVASVPALAAGLNSSASVPLTRFAALELQVLPFQSYSGYEQTTVGSLSRLGCSSSYQRGQLRVSARLSDASTVAVTAESAVVSLTPLVLTVQSGSGQWVLAPLAAGAAVVNASFHVQSTTLTLPVSNEENRFTSVALSVSGVSAGSSNTFGAQVGTQRSAAARLDFEDGTRFDDVAAVDWVTASSFVRFESSDEGAINVTAASGTYTLLSNGWGRTTLTARSVCDSTVLGTLLAAANLEPALGDVDLGSSQGLQFQQTVLELQVPVRANSADGVLVNYQIEVVFDPSVFVAQTCSSGALQGFTCTLNDPLERAKLIATDTASQASGSSVLLGSFTLSVQASSVTLLSGSIVELVRNTNGGSTEVRISDESLVAGRGYADVQTGGRRLHEGGRAQSVVPSAYSGRRRGRELATACVLQDGCNSGRWGDINGDCRLTAYDVLWARQVIIGQRPLDGLCPWAQQQLDPTLDGETATVVDARYLQLAAANKYRFLANVSIDGSAVVAGSTNALVVTVLVLDDLSEPAEQRTTVRFEMGYALSSSGAWLSGAGQPVYTVGSSGGTAGPNSNWIANAVHVGGGEYRAAVYPSGGWQLVAADAGVAVMIETQDALGQGESERNFPFMGSNAAPYANLTEPGSVAFRRLRSFSVLPAPPPSSPSVARPASPPLSPQPPAHPLPPGASELTPSSSPQPPQ